MAFPARSYFAPACDPGRTACIGPDEPWSQVLLCSVRCACPVYRQRAQGEMHSAVEASDCRLASAAERTAATQYRGAVSQYPRRSSQLRGRAVPAGENSSPRHVVTAVLSMLMAFGIFAQRADVVIRVAWLWGTHPHGVDAKGCCFVGGVVEPVQRIRIGQLPS